MFFSENVARYIGAAAVLCIALLTTKILEAWIPPPSAKARVSTIDGLRGYLGLAVFIHHASFWKLYASTGIWMPPPTFVIFLFGGTSVKFFFMITSFLFFSKLLNSRGKEFDFLAFFVSRAARLTPLYWFAMALMLLCVFAKTHWRLAEPFGEFLQNALSWIFFTVPGKPNINELWKTDLILSGATWTLPYEWVFYFSIPLFAMVLGQKPKILVILICLAFVITFGSLDLFTLVFAGGIIAALAVKSATLARWCKTTQATVVLIALLAVYAVVEIHFSGLWALVPLVGAFVIIALGNSCFGLFTARVSRSLGEYTYSIYLLHGILLYTIFNFMTPPQLTERISEFSYWCIIMGATPPLIFLAAFCFKYIEQPAMQKTRGVPNWLRSKSPFLRTKVS